MQIAKTKRKDNIAEYLLYMWQAEDIIRSMHFSIDAIQEHIISQYPPQEQDDTRYWWENLIEMMQKENLRDHGHLQINKNVILQLTDLHLQLLKSDKFPEYGAEYYRTLPYIVQLRAKAGTQQAGELETCFNALYGILMLRLQHKSVSAETTQAIQQISKLLAMLAAYFKKDEQKPLFEDDDQDDTI